MVIRNYTIDYTKLVDEAMCIIVYKVLKMVEQKGLPSNHHFLITFATRHPGVVISHKLLTQYPDEMTVIIQNQFFNLKVNSSAFEISLSFNGVLEHITIPFDAIILFEDPSMQFSLQLRDIKSPCYDDNTKGGGKLDTDILASISAPSKHNIPCDGNVFYLDYFRKK